MVYIIIFAIILCGIYRYDFLSRTDAKLGVFSYIFILLTCVSVLKYRVGSDILVYMSEYGDYLPLNKLTVSYVFDNANRQPGWIFLISILKSFSNDFFVFQFVQAIFINYAISRTIVFNTKYIFTATLFYFVYLYTELNFEVMRESFAVGFFLFSLEADKRNLWFKYYILVSISFLFHLSAFFLLVLPVLKLLPIHKKAIWGYLIILSLFSFLFLPDLHDTFKDMDISLWAALDEKATSYLASEKYKVEWEKSFLFKSSFVLAVSYWISVIKGYYNGCRKWEIQLGILYFIFETLNTGIPFFYRFNNYILLVYLLMLTNSIYAIISHCYFVKFRGVLLLFLICIFIYLPINSYFRPTSFRGVPEYRKYYPYYTIFTKEKDLLRERAFR